MKNSKEKEVRPGSENAEKRQKAITKREVGRAFRLGQVKVLYEKCGYTFTQIAEELGITESSARSLVSTLERFGKK